MTEADLHEAGARYTRAFARADDLRAERDKLVREALRAGWTHAKIADAAGMTRGRVGQIAQTNPRRSP